MFWVLLACTNTESVSIDKPQYAFVQTTKEQTLRYQELLRVDLQAEGYEEHVPLSEDFS